MKKLVQQARSWIEIDTKALTHNLCVFRKMVGKNTKVMTIVKSNAYGHGLIECAKVFEEQSRLRRGFGEPSWLGVDDLDEALALRKAGIRLPILVLGYTLPSRYYEAVKKNVSLTIASLDSIRAIYDLKIHIKLETGLNRQGITEQELPTALALIRGVRLEGVYSHFAVAELAGIPKYKNYCEQQMDKFERMYDLIVSNLIPNTYNLKPIRHMAGTSATLLLPRSHYDLVRVGIGLYKDILSWRSIISQIKIVKKGERVGYDLTERVKRDSKLAIIPVGYWHGYPRSLSSKGEVLVRGKRCKIVGRVSMDMLTIDVTNVRDAKAGDKVTLIGKQRKEILSAEEVATKAGTIDYELLTRINPLLPRVYK